MAMWWGFVVFRVYSRKTSALAGPGFQGKSHDSALIDYMVCSEHALNSIQSFRDKKKHEFVLDQTELSLPFWDNSHLDDSCGTIGATTREGLHDVPTKCRQLPCLGKKTARISPLNLQPCSA